MCTGGNVTARRKKIEEAAPPAENELPHLATLKKLRIVIRAAQRHSAWIEKQCGVSGAQLWILQELHEVPGMRVGELARRLAIHQTTVSNLLDALEKRGLITKARDPGDQRAVRIALSPQGAEVLQAAPRPARGLLPEALLQLKPEQLVRLDCGLQDLLDGIGVLDEAYGLQPMSFML